MDLHENRNSHVNVTSYVAKDLTREFSQLFTYSIFHRAQAACLTKALKFDFHHSLIRPLNFL
jgi:hypothetical protein